jgi:hypothetical protein
MWGKQRRLPSSPANLIAPGKKMTLPDRDGVEPLRKQQRTRPGTSGAGLVDEHVSPDT